MEVLHPKARKNIKIECFNLFHLELVISSYSEFAEFGSIPLPFFSIPHFK